MTRRLVVVALAGLAGARRCLGPCRAQVSVSSPYLDIVARYQSGDQAKAVADMAAYPTSGLRDRARKDLRDLTCQVLCGTADCRRARAEKPAEFERVLEAWSASMPAAAALHVDTAIQAQADDRRDVAEAHRQLALELVDLMETELAAPAAGTSPIARPRIADGPAFSGPTQTGPDPQIARRAQASQLVTLLSIWLLQLRGDLPQIQAPLARAQQRFPQDPLVALALGSLHEAHAAPNALVEASAGRQGNLEKWRQEERAYRLEQALVAYRQAVALDPTLAEAHLRLGHVLLLTGKADEADAAFARASAETGDRRWRYLAEMLRADGADARGDRAAARQRYQAALGAWPDAQSPVLALSRLEASDGDWPAAQARLSTLDAARRRPRRGSVVGLRLRAGVAHRRRARHAAPAGGAMTRLRLAALLRRPGRRASCAAGSAHAQQEPPPQPTPLFRAVANVVRVDTLVTERGKPVGKLTADDFELFDDGVKQQVTAASIEDVDIDVVLVLDTSRSVAGTRLQALRDAASALVRNLRPDDRAAVVTFASGVTVNAPLTSDHTAVSRALETADARGATSLVDAAWTSVLLAHGNDRPTLVLIFSDGADTASWLRVSPVVALASRANLVVDAVVAGGARLLRQPRRSPPPVAAAASASEPRDAGIENFLVDLTAATGGSVIDGSGGSRLEGAFVAALREFRTRYQLSYTPTGVDRAGWHPLEVRVRRQGATIRARPGYTQ